MPSTVGRTILIDENHAESLARPIGDTLQNAAGSLTDASAAQARGAANLIAGQVVDEVQGFIVEQPFTALLAAASLGFVVSFIAARR